MGQIAGILAKNLKIARDRAGLTQAGLAEKVGLDPITITNYENQHRWPKPDSLAALAGALGVSEAWLFHDPALVVQPTPLEALEIVRQALAGMQAPAAEPQLSDEEQAILDVMRADPIGRRALLAAASGFMPKAAPAKRQAK